jgi:hypothetical protein
VVVLTDEVEGPPGVSHGAGHVTENPGLPGTVYSDQRRESAKSLLIHDHHPRRSGRGSLTAPCRRFQPPLGILQAGLDALDLAAHQQ